MWSSQFDCDTETQDHYLTIRRVVRPVAYTCALLSTNGEIIDSETHYVLATKSQQLSQFLFNKKVSTANSMVLSIWPNFWTGTMKLDCDL